MYKNKQLQKIFLACGHLFMIYLELAFNMMHNVRE